jgi:hypothetical protein
VNPLDRLEPPPRVVDWGLAATVAALVGTGLYGLFVGEPSGAWVVDAHAIAGSVLVVFLAFKLRRVVSRLRPDRQAGLPVGRVGHGGSGDETARRRRVRRYLRERALKLVWENVL